MLITNNDLTAVWYDCDVCHTSEDVIAGEMHDVCVACIELQDECEHLHVTTDCYAFVKCDDCKKVVLI